MSSGEDFKVEPVGNMLGSGDQPVQDSTDNNLQHEEPTFKDQIFVPRIFPPPGGVEAHISRFGVLGNLQSRGWRLVPVESRGKRPWDYSRNCGLTGWTTQRFSNDTINEIIRQHPEANFGILTGEPSGVAVLDVDKLEVCEEWKTKHPDAINTFTVQRDNAPAGKMHLYYAIPVNAPAPSSRKGEGWDFQSTGRQVVAPGSVHESGGVYSIVKDVPLLPWRNEYLPDVKPASNPQVISPVHIIPESQLPESVRLAIANGAKEGMRNATLLHVACQLRDAGLSLDVALLHALEFGRNCTPVMDEKELKSTLASAYSRPAREPASKQSGKDDAEALDLSGRSDADFVLDNARELAGTGKFFILNHKFMQVSGDRLIAPTPAGLCVDILPKRRKKGKRAFSESIARRMLESELAKGLFPVITMRSDVLLPYQANGLLKFTGPGYDPDHKVWTPAAAIPVCIMPLPESVALLRDLLRDFCFLEPELDVSRTVAYLLTPMLTLLTNGCRAQIFHICGNRPGLGKDYLLALAPIIYTGQQASFFPPAGSDDEYRKMLLAVCMGGDPFFLISNVGNHLASQSLEQGATSHVITGRILGKTELCSAPNRALYGFSSNAGTISADLERRVMDIHLLFLEEDVNKRIFERDLHEYLLKNRALVLSALYSLVQHWANAGFPLTGAAIPSFTKWSQVVSGILVACGFKNPFDKRQIIAFALEDSGNREDRDFAALLEQWFSGPEPKTLPSCHIRSLALQHELFPWLDLAERSGQVAFAAILRQRSMRVFCGLRLSVIRGKIASYSVGKVLGTLGI